MSADLYSIHYLLGFWQKLVGSVPFIRITEPHLLNSYIPEVTDMLTIETSQYYSLSVVRNCTLLLTSNL